MSGELVANSDCMKDHWGIHENECNPLVVESNLIEFRLVSDRMLLLPSGNKFCHSMNAAAKLLGSVIVGFCSQACDSCHEFPW